MFKTNWWQRFGRSLLASFMTVALVLSLSGCGDRAATSKTPGSLKTSPGKTSNISEVSPPPVIQALRQALDNRQPQVSILSPKPDQILEDNTVTVRFQVQDLPIFKNADLGLGPHLHVFLDNQPYKAVYDLNEPLVFEDVAPGTHTIRVFASRPWHESFKNEGAYTQTTFHIFTKTNDNSPNPGQPLLTYSRPQASYGAEPIMLDFYLTNAPLHLVAQENPDIGDWRIRCTVNGESFITDQWQPIYLKGFKPGKNWLQLELIDEQGNPINNVYNNTARVITYEPNGKDTLSQLVRGELSAEDARGIVDPNYVAKKPTPEPEPTPAVTPTPAETPTEIPTPTPTETPKPVPSAAPTVDETPAAEQPKEEPATPEVEPTKPVEPQPTATKQIEKPKAGGYFNRFRHPPTGEVAPSHSLPVTSPVIEVPAPEVVTPKALVPQPEASPEPEASVIPSPAVEPATPSPAVESATPSPAVEPAEPKLIQKPKPGGFFNRFRRPPTVVPTPSPSLPPTLPEIIVTPSPEPAVPEATAPQPEAVPEPEFSVEPTTSVEEKLIEEQLSDTNPSVQQEDNTEPTEPSVSPTPKPEAGVSLDTPASETTTDVPSGS